MTFVSVWVGPVGGVSVCFPPKSAFHLTSITDVFQGSNVHHLPATIVSLCCFLQL